MESKQNDLMLNILENPSFSVSDFLNVGLTADNTSLESESTYASSPLIQNNPLFQNSKGDFDSTKFHKVYLGAQQAYNYLANSNPEPFKATFSKYNIFAPMEQRDWNPQFLITKISNPDLITKGLIRIGEDGPRDRSREEIAQTQLVYDKANDKWLPAPNDDFFGRLFGDTVVLALYDNDVDINGKERGQFGFDENNIEHYAGDYKLNENGTYYYETANGRNIYGKQVLHMSDIITRDGSALNAIDFLDSDGIDKSPIGSFVKNTALIGSMFLPYVGPVIAGATILLQALGLGATLGKIALGSDNKTMNYLEGLSESTNFMNTRSEYSKEHNWSIENLLGMVGDVVGQLKQQRMLFKYLPAVVKGKWGTSEAQQLKLQEKYFNELNTASKKMLSSTKGNPLEFIPEILRIQAQNTLKAADMLETYMNNYYNVGGTLSKAYMTMLTVNDIYGEAIEAGASDGDAALITAGYAAMEYALLSTGLGEWILPELRAARQRARGVTKALTKETVENFNKLKAAATTPEAKRNYLQKIVDFGKKIARADYAVGKADVITSTSKGFGLSKAGVGSIFAGALGEATEETSEELLADFQRSIFNVLQEAKGSNVRLKPWENWQDRYAMSFIGGFIGGGISGATVDYKQSKHYANMTYNQAVQELISMDRNDELKEIYKILDKETIGNKNLSARKVITDDSGNNLGWEQGDSKDNQDLEIKNRVRSQLRLIHDTLNASGGYASDDELLANNLDLLKGLRYNALKSTTSAGKFIQEFNRLDSLYIQKVLELNQLNTPEVKAEAGEKDQKGGENQILEERRQQILQELDDLKLQIEEMRSGKKAPLFMAHALIESTPFISKALMPSTYRYFVENREHKKWEDISEADRNKYVDEWNNYQKTDMKDDVDLATHGYLSVSNMFAGKLLEQEAAMKAIIDNLNLQEYLNSIDSLYLTIATDANLLRNDFLDERLTPDTWIENVQTNENNNSLDANSFLGKILLLTKEFEQQMLNALQLRLDARQLFANGTIDEETLNNTLEVNSFKTITDNYIKSISQYIEQTVYNPTIKLANDFIKSGHINGAIKDKLIKSVEQVSDLYMKLGALLNDRLETIDELVDISDEFPEVGMGLSSFSEIIGENPLLKTYYDLTRTSDDGSVKSIHDLLKELNYTPIMDILDNFVLNVTSQKYGQTKISDLIKNLTSIYNQTKDDVGQFNIDNPEILTSLREGLQLIELLEGVVEGARNDSIRFDTQISATMAGKDRTNLWGINAILNEVHRKAPKPEMDDWVDLPEINGQLADMILLDIRIVKNQLGFYADLYAINSGQKLNKQTRVSTNIDYLLYQKIKKFTTDIVPEDWDKRGLEKALAEASTLEALMEEKPLSISNETYTKIEKERILLETAIYNFFNVDNKDKFTDIKKLSELFKADKFNFFTTKSNLLNENSTTIDDHAFIAWVASKAALNSNDYHRNFKELLENTERAPLASQEIGTYLHLANVLNGDVISNFLKAVKKSMLDYFNSLNFDLRKDLLKEEFGDRISEMFALESGKKYLTNMSFIPSYSNITFVEGIPGAGKSEAVNRFGVRYLQRYNPEVLANAWVTHISEKDAEDYGKNMGLAEGSYQVFDRKSLMQEISDDWNEFKLDSNGDYTIDEDLYLVNSSGQIISTWKLKSLKESALPKVIIIDEISRYTHFDLWLLDKFAKKYGISIITTGDLDQSQARGKFTFSEEILSELNEEITSKNLTISKFKPKDITIEFDIHRNTMMRSPKLGTSLRTANVQKSKNTAIAQAVVLNESGDLKLVYYEDDNNLTGDKIYNVSSTDTTTGSGTDTVTKTRYTLSESAKSKILQDIKQRMIPNLKDGEKIGYVYYSDNSDLYKLIMSDASIANYIERYEGNSAQGKEGKYWIIEINPTKSKKSYLQDLYTGITRAQEASLVITPLQIGDILISSEKEETTQMESLKPETIQRFSKKIKAVYDAVTTDGSNIDYIERTKDDSIETVGDAEEETEEEETEETSEETNEESGEETDEETDEEETELENIAKESTEFVLPEGYSASLVGDKVIFSKPIPVSSKWIKKYFEDDSTSKGVSVNSKDFFYISGATILPDGKIQANILFSSDLNSDLGVVTSKDTLIGEIFNNAVNLTDNNPPSSDFETKKNLLKSEIAKGKLIIPSDITPVFQTQDGFTIIHFLRNGHNVDMPIDPRYLLQGLEVDLLTEDEIDGCLLFIQLPMAIFSIKHDSNRTSFESADGRTFDIEKPFTDIPTPKQIVQTPPVNPVNNEPVNAEEIIITNDDVGTTEEIIEFQTHENKKTNYGHGNEPLPEDNAKGQKSGDSNLRHLLYSNNTFEFGAEIHPKKNTYEKPKHHDKRIDSINGILKVRAIQNKKAGEKKGWIFRKNSRTGKPDFNIDSLSDMIEVLGRLRGKALNTENKQELEKYFQNALGLSNIYCRFAIKNSSTNDEMNKDSMFFKFFKSVKEKLLFNRGGSKKSENIGLRNIVLIVGSMETVKGKVIGDVLELPLLTLNNPITVLKANKDMSNVYGKMNAAYDKAIEEALTDPKNKGKSREEIIRDALPKALRAARFAGRDIKKWLESRKKGEDGVVVPAHGAKNIFNLIDLYLNTDRCIFYQDDPNWTVAGNLISYGPQLNINRGQFDPDYNPDLVQTDKLISLNEFAKDKTLHISRIMVYTRSDGKYEYDGNKEISGFISQPGHPFVLYTDDPELDTDDKLINEFIEQLKNKKGEHKSYKSRVKLAYVIGPRFYFEEYMNSILRFTNGLDGQTLGNIKTPVDVLNALIYDLNGNPNRELLDLFIKIWGSSGQSAYDSVKNVIDSIKQLPLNEQIKRLKQVDSKGLLGFNNKTLFSLLQNVLKQLVQNSGFDMSTGMVDYTGTFKQDHLNILIDLFKRSGKTFHDTSRLTSRTLNNLFAFVKTSNKYQIDNNGRSKDTNFYIHGNLSSSMYAGNQAFNNWIEQIVSGRKTKNTTYPRKQKFNTKTHLYFSIDNPKYTKGESWFDKKEPKKKKTLTEPSTSTEPLTSNLSETPPEEPFYSAEIEKYLENIDPAAAELIKQQYPPRESFDDNILIKVAICNHINSNDDPRVAIIVQEGNKQVIKRGSDVRYIGKAVISNQVQNIDGSISFIMQTKGKTYNCLFKNDSLDITEQNPTPDSPLVKLPIYKLTSENISIWSTLLQAAISQVPKRPPLINRLENALKTSNILAANDILILHGDTIKKLFEKALLNSNDMDELMKQIHNSIINYSSDLNEAFCDITKANISMITLGELPF